MEWPARVAGPHRTLRVLHLLLRILLVGTLLVLLALIAVREVSGLTAAAAHPAATIGEGVG